MRGGDPCAQAAQLEVLNALANVNKCSSQIILETRQLLSAVEAGKYAVGVRKENISAGRTGARTVKVTKSASSTGNKVFEEPISKVSTAERKAFAVALVNEGLQALANSKPLAKTRTRCDTDARTELPAQQVNKDEAKASSRLKEISNNRISSTAKSTKISVTKVRPQHVEDDDEKDHVAIIARCTSLAFSYLIRERAAANTSICGIDCKLEQGMLALAGRLVALQRGDLADLQSLKDVLQLRCAKSPVSSYQKANDNSTFVEARPTLTSLLMFSPIPTDETCLKLVINFQILVLKVILQERNPIAIESVSRFLQAYPLSSPVQLLIQYSRVAGTAEEAARLLESVAQLLFGLCPGLSPGNDQVSLDSQKSASPIYCLYLQSTAFQAQITWMGIAQHQVDAENEIWKPFLQCIKAYARRAPTQLTSTYEAAQVCTKALLEVARDQVHTAFSPPGSVADEINSQLGKLARCAGLTDEALMHLTTTMTTTDNDTRTSRIKRCVTLARVLALRLTSKIPVEENQSLPEFEDLLVALSEVFHEAAEDDLNIMLVEMLQLGQKVLPILSALLQRKADRAVSLPIDICSCFRTFYAIVQLFLRVFPTEQALEKRSNAETKKLTTQIYTSIRTIVVCASSELVTGEIDVGVINQALQDSLQLCVRVDSYEKSCTPGPASLSNNDALVVAISNAYWTWATRCNTQTGQELRAAWMQASVNCLKHRASSTCIAGRLITKLLKLGQMLNDFGNKLEARDTFVVAITEAIRCGVLEVMAIAAASSDESSAWGSDEQTRHLSQALDVLLQLDAAEHIGLPGELPYFDVPHLEPPHRCVLLERQLSLTAQWGTSRRLKLRADLLRQLILPLLLDLYDDALHRSKHKCTAALILYYAITQPGSFDQKALASALSADVEQGEDMIDGCTHVNASIKTLRALYEQREDESYFAPAIAQWTGLMTCCENVSQLKQKVNDIPLWTNMLHVLCEHLHLHRYHVLELQTLSLLLRSYELSEDEDGSNISSTRLVIAQLLLQLGHISEAGIHLNKARNDITSSSTPRLFQAECHIALAEYYFGLGNFEQCLVHIDTASSKHAQGIKAKNHQLSRIEKVSNVLLQAKLLSTRALLIWHKGLHREALQYQAQSVTLVQRLWKSLEASEVDIYRGPEEVDTQLESVKRAFSKLALEHAQRDRPRERQNPLFIKLAPELCYGLLQLSYMVYWSGLYEDALYYAEQALQTAKTVRSKAMEGLVLVRCGELRSRGADLAEGRLLLKQADDIYALKCEHVDVVAHRLSLGVLHHIRQEWPSELQVYAGAAKLVERLMSEDTITTSCFEPRRVRAKVVTETARLSKRPPTSHSVSRVARRLENTPAKTADAMSIQFRALKGRLLRSQSEALLANGNLEDAAALFPLFSTEDLDVDLRVQQGSTVAKKLLLDGFSQMSEDPSFSTLSESVMSVPSAVRPRRRGSSLLIDKAVPHEVNSKRNNNKATATSRMTKSKAQACSQTSSCGTIFAQAYEAAFSTASRMPLLCSVSTVNQATVAGTTSALLTSFAFPDELKTAIHPAQVAWSIELPRMIASLRERDYIDLEAKKAGHDLAITEAGSKNVPGQEQVISLSGFQANLVDIIPENWTAISIALDEKCEHLHVIRYEAHRSPFTLRLPLNRQNVEDLGEETFSFEDASSELRIIIQDSDATVHAARDDTDGMKQKGAKSKWWADREALNDRLRDLLLNVENMWFGGFRGIFSQHQRSADLLARFQQTFENILDKHLPSRQRLHKSRQESKVKLDAHVMDLFVGLTYASHASPSDLDVEEALNDLLYYVVDILQFNGEPNAYDEIDFDSLVVQTIDALQSYHEAAGSGTQKESQHTILILDKLLHTFPWECLPCLEGRSVSRLTSLYDLRERVLAMRAGPESLEPGFHVSGTKGTYILNPSGDLTKTQSRFEKPLCSLGDWDNIINRTPSEEEFLDALGHNQRPADALTASDKSLLLYFGHGSGAQYVRSRRIKRLRTCPTFNNNETTLPTSEPYPRATCNTALLFGCSSASLREASEFEPYGTPKTYLAAGTPALLGSLWDVTDGDCDAFAAGVLERWGLLGAGSCKVEDGKGRKGKATKSKLTKEQVKVVEVDSSNARKLCLSEAVAKSRSECYLKYLNGAAMVVYGVPVFLTM